MLAYSPALFLLSPSTSPPYIPHRKTHKHEVSQGRCNEPLPTPLNSLLIHKATTCASLSKDSVTQLSPPSPLPTILSLPPLPPPPHPHPPTFPPPAYSQERQTRTDDTSFPTVNQSAQEDVRDMEITLTQPQVCKTRLDALWEKQTFRSFQSLLGNPDRSL